jgi:hypothetical protein
MAGGWVHLDVQRVVRVTEKALLVRVDDEEHWLPTSQVCDAEDYAEGDEDCTISITNWLANEKGLS